jgi:hypothetical protein
MISAHKLKHSNFIPLVYESYFQSNAEPLTGLNKPYALGNVTAF